MSQPNNRKEQDKDPRNANNDGNPLESVNPTTRNFQRPNSDNSGITDDANLNKDDGSEGLKNTDTANGGASETQQPQA